MRNVVLTILAESMPTLLGMLLLAFFLQARLHREITGVRQDVAQMEIGLRKELAGHGERLARIEQRLFPGPPAIGPPRNGEE